MNTSRFTCLALLLTYFAVIPACEARPRTVRIGVITSLSGNWGQMGDMTMKGLTLANEELERDGDISCEFVVEDSHEDVSAVGAVSAYHSLRNRKLTLFVGPSGTPAALALAPLFAREEVVAISPSVAVESFHKAGKNIFNAQGAFEIASRLLARRAFADGARKMAIFSSQQPYESAQADAFEKEFSKIGGVIVARVNPLPESVDLRVEALKIIKSDADGVFFSVYNRLATAAKELDDLGFNKLKYAPMMDRSRFEGAKDALDQLVFATLGETQTKFVEKFRARFGMEPDYPAGFAYDALLALGKAVTRTQSSESSAVIEALAGIVFHGASGAFRFDEEGCVVRDPALWRVVGQKFEPISNR